MTLRVALSGRVKVLIAMKRLWISFGMVQALGAVLATAGVFLGFWPAIIGVVLLFPGYLVAYAFMRKVTATALWVPLVGFLIVIPVNAAFWYVYSGKARLGKSAHPPAPPQP